jgi:hypothetical protein
MKTIKHLRKACKESEASGKETFTIEGHDFVVGYAKYLLQFLCDMRKLPEETPLKNIFSNW